MKTPLKIFLIIIALAAAAYGGYLLRGEPQVSTSQEESNSSGADAPSLKLSKETDALSVNITYPAIPGDSPAVAKANAAIKNSIDARLVSFEKDANDSMQVDIGLPLDIKSTVTGSSAVEERNNRYISVFLGMEWYLRGAAHPGHSIDTYVYDFKEGKLVAVSDFFKADAQYLEFLSSYSRNDLTAQSKKSDEGFIFDQQMLSEGTAPTKDNFSKVLPTKEGLIVYFDEYQVAPYAAGPQKVVVPYAKLKDLVDPNGILGMYIQ